MAPSNVFLLTFITEKFETQVVVGGKSEQFYIKRGASSAVLSLSDDLCLFLTVNSMIAHFVRKRVDRFLFTVCTTRFIDFFFIVNGIHNIFWG